MLKKYKLQIIVSSIVILLPVLFGLLMWDNLPDIMTTHWGADGTADGFSGKVFAVFGLPCVLLAGHLICLLFTLADKKQINQNAKALGLIFWILPIISLFVSGITYRAAFGHDFDLTFFTPILFGLLFIVVGNYFPKTKQNLTLGIKIPWTLSNEENWNKTHRFAGKLWVLGGIIVLLSAFLPLSIMSTLLVCVIFAVVIIPMFYSYSIYKQHQREGIIYNMIPKTKAEKTASKITIIAVPLILVAMGFLLFTGDIAVESTDNQLIITADYYSDLTVDYTEIDGITYRNDLITGRRINGFGSPRLSMGLFKNDEFGSYTLYAYTVAGEYIVLTAKEKTLVIGLDNPEETQELYQTLTEKIAK